MNSISPNGGDAFLARYRGLRDRLPGDVVQRDMAAELFEAGGLPTMKSEAWRYTSLRGLADIGFQEPLTEVSLAPVEHGLPELPRLVLVDGRYQPGLSTPPEGVTVTTFAANPLFSSEGATLPMVAINTMLAEDGLQLHVAAGVDAGTVLVLSITPDAHRPIDFHPRHSIVLEAGARLSVVEVCRGDGVYLHNAVTSVAVAEGATLMHARLQEESAAAFHVNTTMAHVAERGTYDAFVLTLGGRLARTEVHARLTGPGGAPERGAVAGRCAARGHHDGGVA
jgi:Fe-S cluster assembly protein SufD